MVTPQLPLLKMERTFYAFVIIVILLIFYSSHSISAKNKEASDDHSAFRPKISQLSVLQDVSKTLNIDDILSGRYGFKTAKFKNITENVLWYKFLIIDQREIKTQTILQLDYPPLQKVEFYYKDRQGNYLMEQKGTSFPVSDLHKIQRMPIFSIPGDRDSDAYLYLRIETETPVVLNLKIYDEGEFIFLSSQNQLLIGGFYGIIVVMLVFNFFLYLSTKDFSCLLFIFFLASYGFLQSLNDGLLYQYIWPNNTNLNAIHISIFMGFYYIFGSTFSKAYLKTKKITFPVDTLLNVGVIVGILIILSTMTFPIIKVQKFGFYFLPVFIFLQLTSGIISAFAGLRPSRMYILSLIPLLIFVLLEILSVLGLTTHNTSTTYLWQFTSFCQMLLISFALGNRFKSLQIEKKKEIEKLRRNIFRDLHDDVGNNLASVFMMSQRYLNNEQIKGTLKNNLQEITDTISNTSESLREIIWFNNPENYSIENFILHLKNIAGKTLKDINFTFDIGEINSLKKQPLLVQKNLCLMFKEILSNILKHANATNIYIEIKESRRFIIMRIRDDGKGFTPVENCDGMGLKNLRLRASEIGSIIDIISEPDAGTEISIKINKPPKEEIKLSIPNLRYTIIYYNGEKWKTIISRKWENLSGLLKIMNSIKKI